MVARSLSLCTSPTPHPFVSASFSLVRHFSTNLSCFISWCCGYFCVNDLEFYCTGDGYVPSSSSSSFKMCCLKYAITFHINITLLPPSFQMVHRSHLIDGRTANFSFRSIFFCNFNLVSETKRKSTHYILHTYGCRSSLFSFFLPFVRHFRSVFLAALFWMCCTLVHWLYFIVNVHMCPMPCKPTTSWYV